MREIKRDCLKPEVVSLNGISCYRSLSRSRLHKSQVPHHFLILPAMFDIRQMMMMMIIIIIISIFVKRHKVVTSEALVSPAVGRSCGHAASFVTHIRIRTTFVNSIKL